MKTKSRLTFVCNAPPVKYITTVRGKKYPAYRKQAKYKCECGNIVIARTDHVKNGNTKSCGCYDRDKSRNNIKKNIHDKGLHKLGPKNVNRNHEKKRGRIAFYPDITTRERIQKRSRSGNLYWVRSTKGAVYLTPEELDEKLNELWGQENVA